MPQSNFASSLFIRENLLENGLGLSFGHRIIETFPRLLKLEQLASDFRAEMAGGIFGVLDEAVEFQGGAQQPFALEFVLRECFHGRFLLDDSPVLTLKIIVDRFNPGSEESVYAQRARLRSVR